MVEAGLGFSLLTLALSYVLTVYSALGRRNTFALNVHHRTGGTDDAAELLARLVQVDDVAAQRVLEDLSVGLNDIYDSHQSYPLLHYFRQPQPYYAMSSLAARAADVVSLARAALPASQRQAWEQWPVAEGAYRSAVWLLRDLSGEFLPGSAQPDESDLDEDEGRRRFQETVVRLRATGIDVNDSPEAEQAYLKQRRAWAPWVKAYHDDMSLD